MRKLIGAVIGLAMAGAVLAGPVVGSTSSGTDARTVEHAHEQLHSGPADQASAHQGVRFCLTSNSYSGTRVYWHGPSGATQSTFINPGGCLVYPAGGHLISKRIAAGWLMSGQRNGVFYQAYNNNSSGYTYPTIVGYEEVRYLPL